MKIEALTRIKDKPYDEFYSLDAGDTKTVPDDVVQNWVNNGWAKNLETGEENPKNLKPVTLEIHNGTLGVQDNRG